MWATTTEAAVELGVSRQCVVTNYLRTGQLKGEFVGGRWLIPRTEIERFKKIDRPYGQRMDYRRNGKRKT
jgi:excisionase family DNA binding protein